MAMYHGRKLKAKENANETKKSKKFFQKGKQKPVKKNRMRKR